MEMTEPFATTTAAVAPVILIAAALEVASYQRAVQDSMSRLAEQLEPEVTALLRLPVDERRAAMDRLLENRGIAVSAGLLKTLARWVLGAFWVAIMMAQVFVTAICLGWLGNPQHSPSAHVAEACWIAVFVGAFAVATFPMYRLLSSPWIPVAERFLRAEIRRRFGQPRGDGAA